MPRCPLPTLRPSLSHALNPATWVAVKPPTALLGDQQRFAERCLGPSSAVVSVATGLQPAQGCSRLRGERYLDESLARSGLRKHAQPSPP